MSANTVTVHFSPQSIILKRAGVLTDVDKTAIQGAEAESQKAKAVAYKEHVPNAPSCSKYGPQSPLTVEENFAIEYASTDITTNMD